MSRLGLTAKVSANFMCGRYTLRKLPKAVAISKDQTLTIEDSETTAEYTPRFNIAPTQNNLVLKPGKTSATLDASSMRWGLVPSWSKTARTTTPLINARSETIADKPSFKAAFQRRRCIVPADGFYEWKKRRSGNSPFHFSLKDQSIFYMAGIWETWQGDIGEHFDSYTLLTTSPNSLLAKYHDRMPVILQGEGISRWLDHDSRALEANALLELFTPIDADLMQCQAANPKVNNNTNEGPGCLEAPVVSPASQLDLPL